MASSSADRKRERSRGAIGFGDLAVLFAEFDQRLDMLGDKRYGCDQDVLAGFRRPLDFRFGRRADPFQRANAGLVAGDHFPMRRHPARDCLLPFNV